MTLFKGKYRVESFRLKNWDYSSPGYYFITFNTWKKNYYLGDIINNKMVYSKIGEVARKNWLEIPKHFEHVSLDQFVIMPNHIHGIIIVEKGHGLSPQLNKFSHVIKGSISIVVNQFKASVTRWCRINNFNYFAWQTLFYDKIIRNKKALQAIRKYIIENPMTWHRDRNNLPPTKTNKQIH